MPQYISHNRTSGGALTTRAEHCQLPLSAVQRRLRFRRQQSAPSLMVNNGIGSKTQSMDMGAGGHGGDNWSTVGGDLVNGCEAAQYLYRLFNSGKFLILSHAEF